MGSPAVSDDAGDGTGGATPVPPDADVISAEPVAADRWSWKVVRRIRQWLRPREDESVKVDFDWEEPREAERPFLVAYWEAQHQRVAAHENLRVQVSGFVVAGSLVAAVALGTEAMTPYGRIGLWLAIALGNAIAVGMIRNELRWIKVHQTRARAVLKELGSGLSDMQLLASQRWMVDESKRSTNKPRFTSTEALILIHLLVPAAALVVAICAAVVS